MQAILVFVYKLDKSWLGDSVRPFVLFIEFSGFGVFIICERSAKVVLVNFERSWMGGVGRQYVLG